MVGHICRFDPRVTLAKEAIEQGRIGQIISMHARRNLSKAIGRMVLDDISALMGDGIHDADLMLWFSQAKVTSVYAQEIHPGQNKYPDAGWSIARLDNGAVAVVESVWHLPETTPYAIDARLEVIGTEGALYINCGEAGLEIHDAAGVKLPDTMYWPRPLGRYAGILQDELRYFADCIRAGEAPDGSRRQSREPPWHGWKPRRNRHRRGPSSRSERGGDSQAKAASQAEECSVNPQSKWTRRRVP